MTSHTKFGERTPGSEVAKVFADNVRGKRCQSRLVVTVVDKKLTCLFLSSHHRG